MWIVWNNFLIHPQIQFFAELLRYLPDVCATFETAFFEQADAGFVLSRNQCHYVAEAFLADDLFQSEYGLFSISSSCKLRFQVEGQLYRDAEGDVYKRQLLLLSTRLLINMEEFEGVKTGDIAELKRIIGQENVTIRKVYDTQAQLYPRRASFIGSTNNMQFLKDYGGNRRFLVIPVKTIDYRTPVDHLSLIHILISSFIAN